MNGDRELTALRRRVEACIEDHGTRMSVDPLYIAALLARLDDMENDS